MTTTEKIKSLRTQLAAYKRLERLEDFKKHLSDVFEEATGKNATIEETDDFFNSEFEIYFKGKTLTIGNSAEVYNSIEALVNEQIEEATEWIEYLEKKEETK